MKTFVPEEQKASFQKKSVKPTSPKAIKPFNK